MNCFVETYSRTSPSLFMRILVPSPKQQITFWLGNYFKELRTNQNTITKNIIILYLLLIIINYRFCLRTIKLQQKQRTIKLQQKQRTIKLQQKQFIDKSRDST